ncbi:MAG: hypothetical protein OJF47_001485 [Nitrospira sp.]|nr:MAG: hypothetical protein OJF47_001485 [Nitrospira sp.]
MTIVVSRCRRFVVYRCRYPLRTDQQGEMPKRWNSCFKKRQE